jgi:hypothetical protein
MRGRAADAVVRGYWSTQPVAGPALPRSVRSPIMRVATGKIVEGKVVTDGAPFEDGVSVTVIAADDAETFELGPEDEAALLAAIGEANHDEVVDGAELIAKLSSRD